MSPNGHSSGVAALLTRSCQFPLNVGIDDPHNIGPGHHWSAFLTGHRPRPRWGSRARGAAAGSCGDNATCTKLTVEVGIPADHSAERLPGLSPWRFLCPWLRGNIDKQWTMFTRLVLLAVNELKPTVPV